MPVLYLVKLPQLAPRNDFTPVLKGDGQVAEIAAQLLSAQRAHKREYPAPKTKSLNRME